MSATVTYARGGKWAAPTDECVLDVKTRHAAGIQQEMKMNRKELVAALADKTGSTKVDADRNIAALLEIISGTLKKGDKIALIGFGSFEIRKRAARTGRNPKTGEALKIKASRVPAFKAGATLKAAVSGAKK
ncbi:MAG: HU family DNA-binding protein [Acidithiobacillus ferriphilus]